MWGSRKSYPVKTSSSIKDTRDWSAALFIVVIYMQFPDQSCEHTSIYLNFEAMMGNDTLAEKNISATDPITSAPVDHDFDNNMDKLTETGHKDVGWDAYQAALEMDPAERDVIAERVKQKLDRILMPLVS
jgi:hypothetical protein